MLVFPPPSPVPIFETFSGRLHVHSGSRTFNSGECGWVGRDRASWPHLCFNGGEDGSGTQRLCIKKGLSIFSFFDFIFLFYPELSPSSTGLPLAGRRTSPLPQKELHQPDPQKATQDGQEVSQTANFRKIQKSIFLGERREGLEKSSLDWDSAIFLSFFDPNEGSFGTFSAGVHIE